jgi:hypothetical protein
MLSNINTKPSDPRSEVLKNGDAPVFSFWYLQSPRYLVGQDRFSVVPGNPPFTLSDMTQTQVDLQGRLLYFRAVPPQLEDSPQTQGQPAWSTLFAEAGLDASKFNETVSLRTPPHESDARATWDGMMPGPLNIPIQIDAAAFHGKFIYFNIIYPWDRSPRPQQPLSSLNPRSKTLVAIGLVLATVIGASFLALRNVRLGLSDQQGAFRLSLFTFLLIVARGMLVAHHVPTLEEALIVNEHLAWALLPSVTIWIIYLALEPFVRGRWPHRIISWKRLISGQIHDPLVARDIMLGVLVGVTAAATLSIRVLLPPLFGLPAPLVARFQPNSLRGLTAQVSQMLASIQGSPFIALSALFVLLILSTILRSEWLAAFAVWVLATLLSPIVPGEQLGVLLIVLFITGLFSAILIFGLLRFGLLTATVAFFTWSFLFTMPLTSNFSSWFASATILVLIVLLGVAFFGFYNSMAGRPVFK